MRRRTTASVVFIIRSHFNCAPWFVCSQPYILAVKSRTQGNPYARKSRTYRGIMPPAGLVTPGFTALIVPCIQQSKRPLKELFCQKKTASVTTPPLCESTRDLRRILRGTWKVQKENYGKRKIRPRYVTEAVLTCRCSIRFSISTSAPS